MSTESLPSENSTSTAPESGSVVAAESGEDPNSAKACETPGATAGEAAAPASTTAADAAVAVEIEAESVRPPPPMSLRVKAAKNNTSSPIGVTAQLPAPNNPPRTVADLMTRKIITVGEQEPIGNLEAWMEKFRFRHLPVVETGMKLVGLISRTDLLHAELGRMPDGTPAPKVDGSTLAGAIMNRNVVFAQLDTPIPTVCRVMLDKKLTCIPVVLGDHTLVGILTGSDFIRLSMDLLEPKA